MPSKNRQKNYSENSYYHIYNRGVAKQDIFVDDKDYRVFLNLLKRYLSNDPVLDNKKRPYEHLDEVVKLLSYCLMPNHFHLFIFQIDKDAMTRLMRGVATSYTTYFNKKYDRVGPLFQDRYKASHILNESYLLHISRYIHRNPKQYLNYPYSSLGYILGTDNPEWLDKEHLLALFDESRSEYLKFINDDKDYIDTIDEVRKDLAV